MYIEPFNCTMRVVCFDFGTGNMDSSVIKTGKSLLPVGFDVITS